MLVNPVASILFSDEMLNTKKCLRFSNVVRRLKTLSHVLGEKFNFESNLRLHCRMALQFFKDSN
jgi:hypothetical protein